MSSNPEAPIRSEPALRMLLHAASNALRSYQYGNSAPDLAKEIADQLDAALAAQPREAEPAAWRHRYRPDGKWILSTVSARLGKPDGFEEEPLYAAKGRGHDIGKATP